MDNIEDLKAQLKDARTKAKEANALRKKLYPAYRRAKDEADAAADEVRRIAWKIPSEEKRRLKAEVTRCRHRLEEMASRAPNTYDQITKPQIEKTMQKAEKRLALFAEDEAREAVNQAITADD